MDKKNHPAKDDVLGYIESIMTPEEIAESDLRVALISELIQARQESGTTSPNIATEADLKAHCLVMEEYERGETISHDAIDWD